MKSYTTNDNGVFDYTILHVYFSQHLGNNRLNIRLDNQHSKKDEFFTPSVLYNVHYNGDYQDQQKRSYELGYGR